MNICECGCKQECKKRFVRGHHILLHNPSVKGRIPWNKGLTKEIDIRLKNRILSEEMKSCLKNFCQCNCGQKCKNRFIRGHHRKGVVTSERTKVLLSKSNTGVKRTEKTRKKNSIANKGRVSSHKGKSKLNNPELKFGGQKKGYKHTEHTHIAMRVGQRRAYEHRGPEIAEKRMRNSGKHRFPYVFSDGTIKKMRSNWEVLYAQHLDFLCIKWQYEPRMFELSTGKYYFPDFYLPDLNEYHEIKGWTSPQSQEKMNLFQTEYPNEKLVILRGQDLKNLGLQI